MQKRNPIYIGISIILVLVAILALVYTINQSVKSNQTSPTVTGLVKQTGTDTIQPTLIPSHLPPITKTPTYIIIPSATSTILSLSTAAPVLEQMILPKGPDLIYTGLNTEMKIFWQGKPGKTYQLEWGMDETYSLGRAEGLSTGDLYTFTINGLQPGTHYLYRVVSGTESSGGSFYTAPEANTSTLKFVVYGDTRSHPELHNTVAGQVDALFQSDPGYQTINLFTGDFVNDGDTPSAWDEELFSPSYKNIRIELANIAVLPVMGNHEGSGRLFSQYFPMPFVAAHYWSFDYGPAHFVMLDQYTSYGEGSKQYDWLKDDLAGSTKLWKFVVLHEPGWSTGGGHDNNVTVQKDIQPLLKKYGVAAVFAGHNHYYARAIVDGIVHLTVGTGGAPLYPLSSTYPDIVFSYSGTGYARFQIEGNTFTGQFVDSSGNILDTFTENK
jgi:hypothetical protein